MTKMSIRKTMLLGIMLTLLFVAAVITVFFMLDTNEQVRKRTESGMRELLASNARIVGMMTEDVVNQVEHMCVDVQLRNILQSLHERNASQQISWQDDMRKIVFNYLDSSATQSFAYVYDVNIFSPDFSYSDQNYFTYDYTSFLRSELYASITLERRPYYGWAPTRDAADLLSPRMRRYLSGTGRRVDTQVVRLVKRMNIATVNNNSILVLPGGIPRPYIVVSIDPQLFQSAFSQSRLTPNSRYMTVTEDGQIISCDSAGVSGALLASEPMLGLLREAKTYRSAVLHLGDAELLVGVYPASVDTWRHVYVIPTSDIRHSALETLSIYLQLLLIVGCLSALFMVFFVRNTLRPVRDLAQTAEHIAKAQTGVLLTDSRNETDCIMTVIQSMNEQIERLSENNIELAQREKDANILMLEMQINPHFLLNSLNKLHMRLLSAGQQEVAGRVIALARALRYSVDSRSHVVYLYKDLEQLGLYLAAMQSEHDHKFAVYYDIEEPLYHSIVPKMLLQPFVENSILHGFKDAAYGCLIHIEGALEGGDVIYTVTDNGVGIAAEKRDSLLSGTGRHIGCANVHKRIQLLFGESYGITVLNAQVGTKLEIKIPYITENTMDL